MTTKAVAEEDSASPLTMFILAMLSSMMAPTLGDQHLGRLAAREAVEAYRSLGRHELVTIGQIVEFAVTALDTLRLSMPEAVSLPMKLRLRGCANGLNRSSRDSTRLLEKARLPEKHEGGVARVLAGKTEQGVGIVEKLVPLREVEDQLLTGADPLTGADWADAMKSVAASLEAEVASGSAEQRETDAMWIEALNGVGAELMRGKRQSAGSGVVRLRLMGALEPGVPLHLFRDGKRKLG
jgi:hypothetical protein